MTEQELYEKMCCGCPFEKRCHNEATTCEDFEKELEKNETKRNLLR